ncbi:MAG: MMPL family transporter [Thermoanaerobaculia bacterium]|nr:MMPL family transporter [Thermoanaerobaculia bacterium]
MLRLRLARVALFARRRYRVVFAVTGVVVVVCLGLISRLEFDTDVLALLPRDEPTIETFRDSLDRFGSLDYLPVAVRVPADAPMPPYEELVGRIAARLSEMEEFEQVEYRLGDLDSLVRELLPTAPLFLDEAGLEALADRLSDDSLRRRAQELRRLILSPQSLALNQLLRLDPFGLAELFLERLRPGRSGLALDWSSGYLLSRDRRMLLVLAKPEKPPQDVDFAKRLVAAVQGQVEEARAEWEEIGEGTGLEVPEVVLGGRYVIAIGDEKLIRSDAIANLGTSMLGVLLLFLIAFRRFGPLLYAFVPLTVGLILSFGLAAILFGGLSAATSGTAALLIGLGIDFVIVSYGRYVEERRQGADLETALAAMSGSSGRAVVVGAITSAATFYSFGVTDFTGLYQMGNLSGTGILLCMVAVLLLLPAMLSWNEDHHRRRRRFPRLVLHGFGAGRWIRFCLRRPVPVLAAGALLTGVAGYAAFGLRFDDSVASMRPKGNPATAVREEIASRFGSAFDQMLLIVRGSTREEAVARADLAVRRVQPLVEEGVLTGVDSIASLLPPRDRQERALAWLAAARADRLDPERIRSRFQAELRQAGLRAEPLAPGMELFLQALRRTEPLGVDEVRASEQASKLLDRYLVQGPEGWESAVYLYPPPKVWRREPPPQLRRIEADLAPDAVLTGANVVSEFLRRRVLEDAVLAAALGLVLVALLLAADFRNVQDAALSLVPILIGVVWMLGAMAALGLTMNFMNIFVSTMIIGIGVDYGIHMIHRYRELGGAGDEKLFTGLTETGKAIVLAALSTIVGFGSLSRSHYPGLASMGLVAILGALSTCLVSISLLPAWVALRRRLRGGDDRGS